MSNLRGVEFIAFMMGPKRNSFFFPQIFSWLPTNFNTFALAFFLWYDFFFCKTEIPPYSPETWIWAWEMERLIPDCKFHLGWTPEGVLEVSIPSLLAGYGFASTWCAHLPFLHSPISSLSRTLTSFTGPSSLLSFSNPLDTPGWAILALHCQAALW